MTYRLIGLMSVVLLLSLAAFAVLIDRYQDEVMEELERTVSQVGRETLRSVEPFFLPGPADLATRPENPAAAASGPDPPGGQHRILIHKRQISGAVETEEFIVAKPKGPLVMPGRRLQWKRADGEVRCRGSETTGPCVGLAAKGVVIVQAEKLHTVVEPGKGFTLRIPTISAPSAGAAAASAAPARKLEQHVATVVMETEKDTEELAVSISTSDYTDLYAAMRKRSAYVALGVFLLGSLLAAALATRFMRPIRRLDAGIRSLTEGNLDVEVDIRGKDEIGRLGRTFNEMTRRLRVSRERSRELTRREKQAALGRLAAGVAHDVRNPLHSIGLTLQHLQETCRPDARERSEKFDRSLGLIRGEIQRLDRLVGNFLRFARSERRPGEPVDLVGLLGDVLRLVEKEADRRRVTTELVVDGDIPPLAVNAEAIRSSVLNLVLNAFEAMPEGGTLTLGLRADESTVWLDVADTGVGIPEAEHERVFEFAYTTREGGYGLGLAMVHQVVVEEHGGRISLESEPAEGTRLRLAFPRHPATEEA